MRPSRPAVVLTILAGVALAACSGSPAASGSPGGGGVSAAPSASASEPAASASASASAEPSASASASAGASSGTTGELEMTALDFSYEVASTVQAGPTTISMKNDGQEEHQAQMARLADGKKVGDVLTALQSNDFAAFFGIVTLAGGPTSVLPGETGTVGLPLEPGNYVFLCFVTSADNTHHFAKGMVAPLEVTEPATAGELPAGDASMTAKDFTFEGLDTLTAGPHTVSFTNEGPQPHEATIVKLADGVTVDDLKDAFNATEPPTGPPPFTSAGGIAAIAANANATFDVDLEPGDYAFLCFVPDPATNKAHAQLGMVTPLTVE
jgi:plastocyanin